MTTSSKHPETIGLHGGDYRSDPATTSVAVPIYQTTSYQFNNTDHAANLFALKEFGNMPRFLQTQVLGATLWHPHTCPCNHNYPSTDEVSLVEAMGEPVFIGSCWQEVRGYFLLVIVYGTCVLLLLSLS